MFSTFLDRLAFEPVAVRAAVAAVLTFLVASGAIDSGAAESLEVAVVAVLNVVLIASARSSVTPTR